MRRRSAWVLALFLIACGGAGPVRRTPPSATRPSSPPTARESARTAAEAVARPARADRLAAERAAVAAHDAEVIAERAMRGDGTLHLVLEAGRCYGIYVAGDAGEVTVAVTDEHGHRLATERGDSEARLSGLCPRWSGSFELSVRGAPATVLLERDQPSASSAPGSISPSSTR